MLFVILPAYNEGPALEQLLPSLVEVLKPFSYRVFVVDDGSVDHTAQVADRFAAQGISLLQHNENQGLGAALLTGFGAALRESSEQDVIVTMDADNTHPAELLPTLQQGIAEGMDVVVASRFVAGGREVGLSLYRRILSRGACLIMKLLFNLNGIRDYSSGFRAYRAGFLARGFGEFGTHLIESAGFAVSAEILLKLAALGPRCGEVPLVLRYDRKQGKSKMPVLRTIRGYFSLIFRLKRAVEVGPEVEV